MEANAELFLDTGPITRIKYIPLTLYPQKSSRGVSDTSPKRPRFTKIA
jgi:hypothetical protein